MADNIFNKVPVDRPSHSWFDLSHDHKLTLNMGDLVPILCSEVLPGDKFVINSEAMLRLQPMVAPIMHKVDVFIHHFYVPNRILYRDWEKFITGGQNNDTVLAPLLDPATVYVQKRSLADYLGYPLGDWGSGTGLGNLTVASALPFCAYQCIWYNYYRDQNLQLSSTEFYDYFGLESGEQGATKSSYLQALRKRAWEHDYFTSCLPFAQKGAPVTIPIEVTANVDIPVNYIPDAGYQELVLLDGDPLGLTGALQANTTLQVGTTDTNIDPKDTLRAQGTTAETSTTTTINDLRAAYALQRWLEKNARAGTRYTEVLLAHFGVRSSDARLQRPEYIGGSRSTLAISEVLQTSGTADTPQGNMAGHGISVMGSNTVDYYAEEHGFIISILSVRPKTAYHQGLPRFFSKLDRFQYFWPEFAQLGEEAVTNKELFYQNDAVNTNENTFGYLPRYTDYRYLPSRVSGDFHSDLDYWALHRTFTSAPALNEEFIICKPSNRIYAVDPDESGYGQLIGHVYHQIKARRPIPKYGNPGGLI